MLHLGHRRIGGRLHKHKHTHKHTHTHAVCCQTQTNFIKATQSIPHFLQTIESSVVSTSRKMWLEFVASRVTFDVLDCVELLGIALFIGSRMRIMAEQTNSSTNASTNVTGPEESRDAEWEGLSQVGLQTIILVFASLSLLTPAVAIADLSFSLHG